MVRVLARILALKLVRDRWKTRSSGFGRDGTENARGRPQGNLSPSLRHRPPASQIKSGEHPAGEPTPAPGASDPSTPLELEPSDWKQTIRRTVKEIKDDRVTFAAAAMAYYLFLAIFPALIALVGILGFANIDAQGLIDSIRSTLPGGAGTALTRAVSSADNPSDAASITAAIAGIGLTLWSASSGMAALQTGLNVAYDVERERKFVAKRAVALVLLLATLLLGGVPSPVFTLGNSGVFTVIGWILTVAAVMVLFSIYYYLGPNRDSPRWQWVSAGGLIGGALWMAVSLVFGWYVATFNGYGKTYGPLAGVIVLVLWLFLSSLAVLIGGELNAELEQQARKRRLNPHDRGGS